MELKKINEFSWRIDKGGAMNVPAIIYASEKLLGKIREDKSLQQAANVATLPGVQKAVYVMPDAHEGFLFKYL